MKYMLLIYDNEQAWTRISAARVPSAKYATVEVRPLVERAAEATA